MVVGIVTTDHPPLSDAQHDMVDFFMSATDARPVGQLKSIAKKLNVDTGTLKNHELMFAGAVMATNVALLMSTLNTLSVEVASGALVLLSTLIAFSFDETPLRMRGGKRKRRCLTGGGRRRRWLRQRPVRLRRRRQR